MPALSAPDLLDLWERAERMDPLNRSLALAAAADPDGADPDALAALPLGARDARLLALRGGWSPALAGQGVCPACGERVEFALDAGALAELAGTGDRPAPLEHDGLRVVWRPPDSRDLAAAAAGGDPAGAERILLGRCVLGCRDADGPRDPAALPAAVRAALAAAMAAADPLAEVVLDLGCPACDARFPCEVDLADFVWSELRAHALRLVAEVDALARAYGWSEAEVLGLAPARRAAYLELVWGAEA